MINIDQSKAKEWLLRSPFLHRRSIAAEMPFVMSCRCAACSPLQSVLMMGWLCTDGREVYQTNPCGDTNFATWNQTASLVVVNTDSRVGFAVAEISSLRVSHLFTKASTACSSANLTNQKRRTTLHAIESIGFITFDTSDRQPIESSLFTSILSTRRSKIALVQVSRNAPIWRATSSSFQSPSSSMS